MTAAVVLLSGGQDSTTCLYWAFRHFDPVYPISFNYGQRHASKELQAAGKIFQFSKARCHITLPLQAIQIIGDSSLVGQGDVNEMKCGLPASFVPGRNIVFLTFAAMWAHKLVAHDLVGGMCQTDYSGYPDCRRMFIDKMENTLSVGMDWEIKIHTPLMFLTKADTVKLARELPGCYEALAFTHTCYEGKWPPCGKCPACKLRAKGFAEAGVEDPLLKRIDDMEAEF